MKKQIILYITIILLLTYSNIIYAIPNENKLDYIIAKKLFIKQQYDKSQYIFNKIIIKNHPHNKYSQKSKLYKILIKKNQNKQKLAKIEIKDFIKLYHSSKYINHAYYIYSVINYNTPTNIITNLPNFKKSQRSQHQVKKSIKMLKNITNKKYFEKLTKEIIYLENETKKHDIYIAEYYLKKRHYITVINRMNINTNFTPINRHDYKKIYLTIKSCNELFLQNISKNILINLKKI